MATSNPSERAHTSIIHGLRLATPFEIWPGARAGERKWSHALRVNVDNADAPSRFGAGELLAKATQHGELWYAFERHETRVNFTFPGVCSGHIELSHGQLDVHVQDAETSALVLPNTVMAVVVNELGDLALHASAVRLQGRTWAFCGPSTAGKTTCAAALASLGASAVTDDLLRVALAGRDQPRPECYPGVPEFRLRAPHGWSLAPEHVRPLSDERTGFTPAHIADEVSPLHAIVFPISNATPVTPSLVRVQGEHAVRRLLQSSRITWTPRVGVGLLRQLSRVVKHVELYELHVCLAELYQPSQRWRLLETLTGQGSRG